MNKQPKTIQFVSWKKHKLDQALKQVDGVYNDFVDEITFKTVIDFFRKELGFPKSLSVNELIANEPIVPPFPYKDLMLDSAPLPRRQVCPVCKEEIDAPRFTNHLAGKCFSDCKNQLEVITKYFNDQNSLTQSSASNS
ncbi:hypothetical protein M9Y10_009785 [Tritrichomonas musculus]|uniref:Uncharacterized protein n=1 Tax=Tritrichomonas musculus TaxID=1915356 RepID=A0ABR2IQH9_9EUKA